MNMNYINVHNMKHTKTNRNTCKDTNKTKQKQKNNTHLPATNDIYE